MNKRKYILIVTILLFSISFLFTAMPPVYAVEDGPIFEDLWVDMDDDVGLYTRVYRPGPGAYPVILTRTPYGIAEPGVVPDPDDLTAWPLQVSHGYAFVEQDTRGRYSSEGVDHLFYDDGPDGYSTIDWIASQPWCNGKIGMSGGSATGITTYLAAGENHPNLVAALSYVASANLYNDVTFDGGAFRADSMIWTFGQTVTGLSISHMLSVAPPTSWVGHLTAVGTSLYDMYTHTSLSPGYRAVDSPTWMNLPLIEGNIDYSIMQPFGDEILRHPSQDAFRDKLNVQDTIDIPILHVGGWFDFFSRSTLDAYVNLQHLGNQKFFMAPGTHGGLGSLPYDPYYDWFDYWLKGEDTGIMDEPAFAYYCFGAEEWRWADQWPLADIDYTKFYLHDDGILNTCPWSYGAPYESYVYNPLDPVLTWGGRNLGLPAGPKDQRPVQEGRSDILFYTTDILNDDTEISGPVKVQLSVSSNCTDTDFTAKLIDVHPDGSTMLVLDNILRARYRNSMSNPVLMKPNKIYDITINLGDISYVFKAGHRIQIDISSSNFPKYDRNLNSGGELYTETEADMKMALNEIHHHGRHRSYVILPIITPETNVFEGCANIKISGLKYKGPAEFYICDNAVFLHFDDQWIKWDITYHRNFWHMDYYRCNGDLGKLTVTKIVTKWGIYLNAAGHRISFSAKV
ncbi:MAG: CocE/NonD family hydrolase [Candidatus Lokiarchaeota archaeon]|nr:CocE/NonD family hydrolase [Candidatus Lokiarchaeota archaeon]